MAIIDKITGKPWTGPKPDQWLGADKGTYAEYSAMLDKQGAASRAREEKRLEKLIYPNESMIKYIGSLALSLYFDNEREYKKLDDELGSYDKEIVDYHIEILKNN